jgi:hypothetical protein
VAILGIAVAAVARLFGPGNVPREMATEVVASFGSTILVLAVFGLLFRTGLERLLRGAPGREALAQSVGHREDVLQSLSAQDLKSQKTRIRGQARPYRERRGPLADSEVPALRKEVSELRALLADLQHERGD